MKDVILLNNLFNGEYIRDKIGGEIINLYRSDNNKYYIYANPYGNISKERDNTIKYVLFIRSVGSGLVKVIGKAEIKEQITVGVVHKKGKGFDKNQDEYINRNKISYGGVRLYKLGSWSDHCVTFEAKSIYKAKRDVYLATKQSKNNCFNFENVFKINKKANNQSQKTYIEPNTEDYKIIENIINSDFWEKEPVAKVSVSEQEEKTKSFLSIIKKENDELVNSNLLAYFLENDKKFWSNFVEKVLKIKNKDVVEGKDRKIFREFKNIDLFIEVANLVIVIENKIKSGISGKQLDGYSQLEKYYNKIRDDKNYQKKDKKFYLLRPDYNKESYQELNKGNNYVEIKYSQIYSIIKNQPPKDLFFEEFKSVVKKHSSEYDNELFEIMNERFIEQIKTINKGL